MQSKFFKRFFTKVVQQETFSLVFDDRHENLQSCLNRFAKFNRDRHHMFFGINLDSPLNICIS